MVGNKFFWSALVIVFAAAGVAVMYMYPGKNLSHSLFLFTSAIVLGMITVWVSNKTGERIRQLEKKPRKKKK